MLDTSSYPLHAESTEYENYKAISKAYDTTRRPVGVEILLGCLASTPRPLHEQIILDGGCGTGNYIAAVRDKVHAIYGLDLNQGMLVQARKKFHAAASVHLTQGSLDDLPYRNAMFDGMMCNQVIHHLILGENDEQFPRLRRLMQEAHRILRPGGVLVFNTTSHQQLQDGYWWADLIPEAMNRVAQRFPSLERMRAMLEEIGFHFGGFLVPLSDILQGKNYLAPHGPLDKTYRDGDSTWTLATAEELDRALARLRAMHADGSIASYVQQREQLRHSSGQTTSIYAKKAR
ncbi:2-methoxy-6-polyprenyl-1,4-benzoquinol methylase, mitochondrial [Candidatus Entotheonellaceae bacterium PAL068K]